MADDLPNLSAATATVVARPLLARWLFEQRRTMAEAARELGVTREAVRLYCLPFGDPSRCRPSDATRKAIAGLTNGAVPDWTFDDTPSARQAFFLPPVTPATPAEGQP